MGSGLLIKLLFKKFNRTNQMISSSMVLGRSCLVLNLKGKAGDKGLNSLFSISAIGI